MTTIPLFPLGTTLFPDGLLPLRIFEVRYLDMIRRCLAEQTGFGVVALLSGREVRTPEGGEQLALAGTMARIDSHDSPMPSLLHIRCTGTQRFRLKQSHQGKYGLWMGEAEILPDDSVQEIPAKLQKTADRLGQFIAGLLKDRTPESEMPVGRPFRLDDAGWVANRWAELLPLTVAQKQSLLLNENPVARLQSIHEILTAYGAQR